RSAGRSSGAWPPRRSRASSSCPACSPCCRIASRKRHRRLIPTIQIAAATRQPRKERDMRVQGSGFGVQGSGFRSRRSAASDTPYFVPSTQYSVLSMAIVAFVATVGCGPAAVAQPKAGLAPASGSIEVVMAGKPVRKTLTLTTTQPARIEALEQAPIYSKLAAYVGEVLVDYGDKVKKDQPLLKLIAPELDADLAQKRARLEQARAQVLQAESGTKAADAAVATAQAKVVQAEAGTDRAQSDVVRWRSEFSRLGQLATSGSVTRQLADETQ